MFEEFNVKLTNRDRVVLESHKHLVDGLSEYLGNGYEIVLHSLEDCDHAAIKVINGYHTGRSEGAPITDLAISMLTKIRNHGEKSANGITYFSKNRNGESLKSTTIPILGEKNRVIGLLCINFYLNTSFQSIVENYSLSAAASENYEQYSETSAEMIEKTVFRIRDEVFSNQEISLDNKHKEIVRTLSDQGIFNIKGSVQKVAKLLGISKNTVYLHLRHIKQCAQQA